jgi:Protein of unknown function (DUF4245)
VSEQPGRYERSTSGMVGALIVTLLVILGVVALRACNSTDPDVKPHHVDYLKQVRYAQRTGAELVYPASLPAGWFATSIDFSAGPRPGITLDTLTDDQQYAGFVQSPIAAPVLLTTYVDPSPTSGGAVSVPGSIVPTWQKWTDSGGDTALVAHWHHESLMVFGGASLAQLEDLASRLTTGSQA